MRDSVTTDDVPAPRPAGDDVVEFVRTWASRAALDSNVALHPRQVLELLTEQVQRISDALHRDDGSVASVARSVGAKLIAAHFTGPSMLSTVITELQTGLLRAVGLPTDCPHQKQVAVLCGALASGYTEAFRDQLLDEQEAIKSAAMFARKEAEQQQRRSEARLAAVFTGTGIGIGIGDITGHVVEVNPSMCTIFGRDEQDMRGRRVLDMIHPADQERLTAFYTQLIRGEIPSFSQEFQVLHADGEPVWTHVTMSVMPRADGDPWQAIATVENVSDLQLLRGEFNRQNSHDWLTGLPNQTQLRRRIEDLTGLAKPGDKLALCFFDIDGFKVINDGLGHEIGDALLRNMGTVLRSVFDGKSNLVARVAGDGFAVLIDNPASAAEVTEKVDKAQGLLGEPIYIHKKDGVAVSTSTGIVVYEAADISADELIRAAEITLHRAKAAGKAQWMLFEPELDRTDRRRFHLGAIMPGAIETGEFTPVFAPVHTIGERKLVGYNVGLRWRHKDYGVLTEAEFGSLAEETGLVVGLQQWLINRLCEYLSEWRADQSVDIPPLAVTLTPRMARDQNLVGIVREALRDHEAPAELLHLAFPAAELVDPDGDAAESLGLLATLGVHVTVDGFGGGPNLLQLGCLPVESVRLVGEASQRATESIVAPGVRAFVELAHDLGLHVTAPDVETPEQLVALHGLGVDLVSGNAIGRTLTADEVAATLSRTETV